MKIPYPETVTASDHEVGKAIMNELLERHTAPLLLLGSRPWGYVLDFGTEFEDKYPDDAALARAANILMCRGRKDAPQK